MTIGTVSRGNFVNTGQYSYIMEVNHTENEFGQWLKSIRRTYKNDTGDTGLSADDFGKMIGVSHTYVSRLERGERRPSATLIDTIALKLGVDTNFLRSMAELPLVDKSRKESPIVSEIIKVMASMSDEKQLMALNIIKAFSNETPQKSSSEKTGREGKGNTK